MNSYNNQKLKANIIIHFNKSTFFIGEFIKGKIELNTSSSALIKDITIEIFLLEEWKIKEGEKDKSDSIKKRILLYNLNIKSLNILRIIDEDNLLLPIGITFIPFDFRFSEESIPCFEFPRPENRSFIRYTFTVSIISSNICGTASIPLCLLSRPIIESEKKLSMTIKQTIKKWKLFGEGDTILTVSFPENNFKYDSICKLKIEIDNTNGKIITKEFKVTLIREIIYKNKNGDIKFKDSKKLVRESTKSEVKPGQKKNFEYQFSFQEKNAKKIYNYNSVFNPYNIDIEKINFFMPTIKGTLIYCNYKIKISLYFESFVDKNHRPRVVFPVYLVHQLPIDYQLEIQEQIDFEKALKESKIKDNTVKIIDNYKKDYNNNNDFEVNKNLNNFENKQIIDEKDEDELPSLEAIENEHKNRIKNDINNNDNCQNYQNNNYFGEKKKEDYENNSSQPSEGVCAPVPFNFNQNDNINNINNNSTNQYCINNLDNGYPYLNKNNPNDNININNKSNNINQNENEEFSLFNNENQKNENKIYFININEI